MPMLKLVEAHIYARDAAFQQASDVIAAEEDWAARNATTGVNLVQKHFTIKVRGLCQIVRPDKPTLEREAKRVAPSVERRESSGVNLPVAAGVPSQPVNLEESLVEGDPNDYFDELASKRWRRKGDSHGPEPPTVVYRSAGQGCIILGGLPDVAACAMLEQNNVKLIVSCTQDLCTQRGGLIPREAFQIKFNYTAEKFCDKHWDALKVMIKPTLAQTQGSSGSSNYHFVLAGQVF